MNQNADFLFTINDSDIIKKSAKWLCPYCLEKPANVYYETRVYCVRCFEWLGWTTVEGNINQYAPSPGQVKSITDLMLYLKESGIRK